MTIAICIYCGEQKFGAWTPCDSCGKHPTGVEAVARSVVLSDHHLSPEGFKIASRAIKNREPWYEHPDLKRLIDQYRKDLSNERGELDLSKLKNAGNAGHPNTRDSTQPDARQVRSNPQSYHTRQSKTPTILIIDDEFALKLKKIIESKQESECHTADGIKEILKIITFMKLDIIVLGKHVDKTLKNYRGEYETFHRITLDSKINLIRLIKNLHSDSRIIVELNNVELERDVQCKIKMAGADHILMPLNLRNMSLQLLTIIRQDSSNNDSESFGYDHNKGENKIPDTVRGHDYRLGNFNVRMTESSVAHESVSREQTYHHIAGQNDVQQETVSHITSNTNESEKAAACDASNVNPQPKLFHFRIYKNPSNGFTCAVKIGYSWETAILGSLNYFFNDMYKRGIAYLLLLLVITPLMICLPVIFPAIALLITSIATSLMHLLGIETNFMFAEQVTSLAFIIGVILAIFHRIIFWCIVANRTQRDWENYLGNIGWQYVSEIEQEDKSLLYIIVTWAKKIAFSIMIIGLIIILGVALKVGFVAGCRMLGQAFDGLWKMIKDIGFGLWTIISFIDRISIGNVPSKSDVVALRLGNLIGLATNIFVFMLMDRKTLGAFVITGLILIFFGGIWVACFGYLAGIICLIILGIILMYLQPFIAKLLHRQ